MNDHPTPLLPLGGVTDFSRNLRELEQRARRPYSLTRVIRAMCTKPVRLDTLETEVDLELRALNPARTVMGTLVPAEIFSPSRRDLAITTTSSGGIMVQTSVQPEIIPFLRAKTICGRLGATIVDGLTHGPVKFPRATLGGTASWLSETGASTEPLKLKAEERQRLLEEEARASMSVQ